MARAKRERDYLRERQRRIARARRTVTCVTCGQPSVAGMYCEKHVVAQRERCRRFRRRMRADGRCVACARPARPGCARCEEHHERAMAAQRRRRAREVALLWWLQNREKLEEDRRALDWAW